MGSGASTEQAEALRRNRTINEQIKAENADSAKIVKLLLLGESSRHTKDVKLGGLRFSAWRLALLNELGNDWTTRSQYNGLSDSFLLTCGGIDSVAWHPKTVGRRSLGPNKTGPN